MNSAKISKKSQVQKTLVKTGTQQNIGGDFSLLDQTVKIKTNYQGSVWCLGREGGRPVLTTCEYNDPHHTWRIVSGSQYGNYVITSPGGRYAFDNKGATAVSQPVVLSEPQRDSPNQQVNLRFSDDGSGYRIHFVSNNYNLDFQGKGSEGAWVGGWAIGAGNPVWQFLPFSPTTVRPYVNRAIKITTTYRNNIFCLRRGSNGPVLDDCSSNDNDHSWFIRDSDKPNQYQIITFDGTQAFDNFGVTEAGKALGFGQPDLNNPNQLFSFYALSNAFHIHFVSTNKNLDFQGNGSNGAYVGGWNPSVPNNPIWSFMFAQLP